MKKLVLLLITIAASSTGAGQVNTSFGPGGSSKDGSLLVYGSNELNSKIPYDKIKGIPYWNIDFLPAKLYAPSNKLYGTFQAKVNLATREVEYVNAKGETLAAFTHELVKVVFLRSDDSSKILSIFRNDLAEVNLHLMKRKKSYYAQEMNQGPVKLLKVTDRELRSGDSLFRTRKSYFFVDIEDYFIQHENRIEKLKKLNKDEVMKYLPQQSAMDAWIKENKIQFNREGDVLRLLEFYNQTTSVKKE